MAVIKIDANFKDSFEGELVTSRARVPIGPGEGRVSPYDMLLGALASCLYATFLDIVEKKRLSFESAHIEVSGEKRAEVPTTLAWVTVRLTVRKPSDRTGFERSAELVGKYCSIYQTLGHVAQMKTEVLFAE